LFGVCFLVIDDCTEVGGQGIMAMGKTLAMSALREGKFAGALDISDIKGHNLYSLISFAP
jgi:hypothetical protein